MKGSEHFKEAIKSYLDDYASRDEIFVKTYAKESKNIDDCITYILNTVQKSELNGFSDSEIYGMAIHYYEEDDIDIGGEINMSVVINRVGEISEEERKRLIEEALREDIEKERRSAEFRAKVNAASNIELSEEDKRIARETALKIEIEESRKSIRKKPEKKKQEDVQQQSLF